MEPADRTPRVYTKDWGKTDLLFVLIWLSALSDDAQAVVLEVSKAVSAALDEFHFSVEAYGDAIVFGEAPHAGDFFAPVGECSGEDGERSEAAAWGQLLATFLPVRLI